MTKPDIGLFCDDFVGINIISFDRWGSSDITYVQSPISRYAISSKDIDSFPKKLSAAEIRKLRLLGRCFA